MSREGEENEKNTIRITSTTKLLLLTVIVIDQIIYSATELKGTKTPTDILWAL